MIPRQEYIEIIKSGEFVEQEMDIAKGQKAWIFDILRNKTYKDKIGSPIREYVANALDEHTKLNKQDIPVELTLPTAFSHELKIRDFGKGLEDADVVRCFAHYGESDKRESNDFIGAFGIGGKSAFAYTDSFTIISYLNGVKTTFNMYIDLSKVGKIARLTSNPTDEPNGIEIIIPVKPQDISTFQQRGLALVKYFKTKPLIKGVAYEPPVEIEPPVKGKNWKYFGDNRETVIIQGQIGYPLSLALMGQVNYYGTATPAGYIEQWEHDLLKSGLEIELPIGTVEITSSREELEMNDFTVQAIRKELVKIRDEIVDLVSETFKSAKTLVEAKTAYYNFFQKGGSYGKTLHSSIGKVKWNGLELTNNVIDLNSKHRLMKYSKKFNGDIILTVLDKIQCSDELNLYYDDTDRKLVMYKRRAKTLLDAGDNQVTIIQTEDTKALKLETGLDVKKLKKYSAITPTILQSTRPAGKGVDVTKRVKHKVKVFELDWTKLKSESIRGAKSDYWKVAEIEVDKQVYVPIDRFEPSGLFGNSLYNLKQALRDLMWAGVDVAATPIYGIKNGQDVGEMVKADVWIKEQIKSLTNLADEVAVIQDYLTNSLFDFKVDAAILPDGSLGKQYATEYAAAVKLLDGSSKYYVKEQIRARTNLADIIKLDIPKKGQLLKLSADFVKKYPLIKFASVHEQVTHKKDFAEYIKLIDEAREVDASVDAMATAA